MKHNQNFTHFSIEEMKHIRELVFSFTEAVQPKLVTDQPNDLEEHRSYSQEKRLFAGKIAEYKLRHPELSSNEVDWDEFNLLFSDNVFLKSTILLLQTLIEKMEHTRMAYDAEIHKASQTDYEYTRNQFESGKKVYEKKYSELKPFVEPA